MYIEKRANNCYRVVAKKNKKTYRLNFDHRPTQKEIYLELEKRAELDNPDNQTFLFYVNEYINIKSNILSPVTIYDYKQTIKIIPDMLLNAKLKEIDQSLIQKAINFLAKTKGARTVHKTKALISTVLRLYRPDFAYIVFAPKIIKKATYLPTIDDVAKIIKYTRRKHYESALLLAAFGLRKSEICGLSSEDLYDNYIVIRHVKIKVGNTFVIKNITKNYDKDPIVYIPKEIIDRIKEVGLFNGYPDTLNTYLYRTEKKLGIQKFSIHKLRHFYPSILHLYGVPDKYAMKQGRWKTNQVLKNIYQDTYDYEMEKILNTAHNVLVQEIL